MKKDLLSNNKINVSDNQLGAFNTKLEIGGLFNFGTNKKMLNNIREEINTLTNQIFKVMEEHNNYISREEFILLQKVYDNQFEKISTSEMDYESSSNELKHLTDILSSIQFIEKSIHRIKIYESISNSVGEDEWRVRAIMRVVDKFKSGSIKWTLSKNVLLAIEDLEKADLKILKQVQLGAMLQSSLQMPKAAEKFYDEKIECKTLFYELVNENDVELDRITFLNNRYSLLKKRGVYPELSIKKGFNKVFPGSRALTEIGVELIYSIEEEQNLEIKNIHGKTIESKLIMPRIPKDVKKVIMEILKYKDDYSKT